MRFMQNRQEYLVKPGQVFLLHLKGDHAYTTGPEGFVHKRFARIVGPALDVILSGSGLDRIDVVEANNPEVIVTCIRRAIRLLRDKPAGFEKTLSALAYEILNELAASSHARRSSPVQAAVDYVHQHISEPITNDDLAAVAGVSTSYLIRTFTKETGNTPLQYHQRNRMQLAWNLLKRGSVQVKEVAQRVGFDDQLYFSKVFKKTYGLSPRRMRKP
jgi:AraC-like DNA-binding protein